MPAILAHRLTRTPRPEVTPCVPDLSAACTRVSRVLFLQGTSLVEGNNIYA